MKHMYRVSVGFVFTAASAILGMATDNSQPVTVKGYVLDSACAFTKHLDKPISRECAIACAKAGSPLVILSEDGNIHWPIVQTVPSSGQNEKLLPFAGQKVTASGRVFQRGGSTAIVMDKIEPLQAPK
jgi:hypothetical protein